MNTDHRCGSVQVILALATACAFFMSCTQKISSTETKQVKSANSMIQMKTEHSMPLNHAVVRIPIGRQQMIGVKTGFARMEHLYKDIDAAGRLAFDPQLYSAQTEYAQALEQLKRVRRSPLPDVKRSAKEMVRSARIRLKILGLSDRQIARIRPGSAGESNLLLNKKGQNVWVYADIFEIDLPFVHAGETAQISAPFLEGKTLQGKVISVDRVVAPSTQTAKARILVSDSSGLLRPDSFVNVHIQDDRGQHLSVPFDAVFDTGQNAWVFLKRGDQFIPRKIQIQFYAGNNVAIAAGIKAGDEIVTSANFMIDSDSRLKASDFNSTESTGNSSHANKPVCPKGQHWDLSMSMCMPG